MLANITDSWNEKVTDLWTKFIHNLSEIIYYICVWSTEIKPVDDWLSLA